MVYVYVYVRICMYGVCMYVCMYVYVYVVPCITYYVCIY